jgi:tRNA threonylcarbamoyladenosine biosynthesis protein TsaB
VNVLALTTSTGRGGAALLRDGELRAASAYVDLQGHAERVFEAIDHVLAEAGETRATIGALAVDVGPGSFTGVRVGVASAKGIALGLGLPLAGVVSLAAMAAAAFASGAASANDLVIAAIDAKKSEIFAAAYDASGAAIVEPCARPLSPEGLAIAPPLAGGRVIVVGEIAASLALPEGFVLARDPALDLPDAAWIGRLAAARLSARGPDPEVEPLYVRPPDAILPRAAHGSAGPE